MAAYYGSQSSTEDSFEFIDYPKHDSRNKSSQKKGNSSMSGMKPKVKAEKVASPVSKRTGPLTSEDFHKYLDGDGRLVDQHSLRKAIFLGGVEPDNRKQVWQFLFGLYPYSSTTREREVLLLDYIVKYHEMKSRWKTLLVLSAPPGASQLEQGLVARYQLQEVDYSLRSPDSQGANPISELASREITQEASAVTSGEPDFSSLSRNCTSLDINSQETRQQIDFMKIQAQVYVNRHKLELNEMKAYLRLVDKDVPRTDRDFWYFKGQQNNNLSTLRDILITFSAFNPGVGYAQGMNDILARFLVVFDSEVEAYWCFHNYLNKIQNDFTEVGMVKKIELVQKLLSEMDTELLGHLQKHDLGDLLFCHRWLLLGFKREFDFMDSLRVFEILSSHHLEISSLEAETARRRQQMKEFEELDGITRTTPLEAESAFTFELFMCLALLQECKSRLLQCTDAAMVFQCINNLKIDLDPILEKSEQLFFRYCKRNVEESFLLVEGPS